MKTEGISNSQGRSLMILFILGTSLLLSGETKAMEDSWISIIIAMVMAIPFAVIYGKLIQFYPSMGLFDILEKIYGKSLGKLFIIIYTFYFIHLGTLCIRNVTEYIQVVSIPETPQYVTAIFIGALAIYIVNAGLSVLTTWAKIVLPTIIITILITFLLAIPQFNYSYIKPVLYNGWKPVISSGYSLLTFPFAETVVFMAFLGLQNNNKNTTKIYLSSIFVGGILLLIAGIRNILLLGFPNITNIYFPSYYAISLINRPSFLQRIEVLVSTNLLLTGFTKTAICLYASTLGVTKFFNLKKTKNIPAILSILMIIASLFLYKSTMDMFRFLDIYKYYVIPFQFVIPVLTLVVGMIRRKS